MAGKRHPPTSVSRQAPASLPLLTDTVGPLRDYVHENSGFVATLLLSATVTYLPLAARFESFIAPLIILVYVPASLTGALLAHVRTKWDHPSENML